MTKSHSKWLLIVVISLLIGQHRSASILNTASQATIGAENSKTLQTTEKLKQSQDLFLILTTGEQIKLYKFDSNNETPSLLNEYYLVKPTPFDDEEISTLEESSFSRWLLSRPLDQPNKRKSVLPDSQDDDQIYGGDSGWKRPWITHVDYFFDSNFCDSPKTSCLVVVWLDKSNNYVRFGSTPFPGNLLDQPITSNSKRTKILWLHEFPPIEIYRDIRTSQLYQARVHAMVVDRLRHRLHVVLSNGSSKLANRVLSGTLLPGGAKNANTTRLGDEKLVAILEDGRFSDRDASQDFTVGHLNVDEVHGNWLFYYENRQVLSLNIAPVGRGQLSTEQDRDTDALPSIIPRQFNEVSKDSPKEKKMESQGNATGIALDTESRRLFWLDDSNRVFSSSYSGLVVQQVGTLSLRPIIKSSECIQVFRDTIYISDPVKRSLLFYMLPGERKSDNSNGVLDEQVVDKKIAVIGPAMRASGQVLLVEMPTLYGFRVFGLEQDLKGRRNAVQISLPAEETKSVSVRDLLSAQVSNYLSMERSTTGLDGHGSELEISPIELLFNDVENSPKNDKIVHANPEWFLACGELLLISVSLLITCFVFIHLLIHICRRQRQQEIKAFLMENCSN